MGSYFSILTCRNSASDIENALRSLENQTHRPEYIIVVDDGSTDNTPAILKKMQDEFQNIHVITNPDMGYDIGRVVSNWNKAIKAVSQQSLAKTDYHMICTDDTEYEKDYAEKIISFMDSNQQMAIVSGTYDDLKYKFPRGAGRFVRNSFLISKCGLYPEKMGYESAVLYIAKKHGFKTAVLKEAKFKHTRALGAGHHFYEYGASMRTLGYDRLFVLGRFLLYFLTGRPIGRTGAIYMLYHYLTYSPKETGYNSMYDKEIRDFIRKTQSEQIRGILRGRPASDAFS